MDWRIGNIVNIINLQCADLVQLPHRPLQVIANTQNLHPCHFENHGVPLSGWFSQDIGSRVVYGSFNVGCGALANIFGTQFCLFNQGLRLRFAAGEDMLVF